MTGVFHFMAVSLDLSLLIHAISVSQTCHLGTPPSKHSGTAGIAIGQTVLNGDADQIGGALRPQLGFDLAAVVRSGLVADAECGGDLAEAAALRQQPQDFEITRG